MFELYNEKARRVVFFARYEAAQLGSAYIETEHLLLGLMRETSGMLHQLQLDLPDESIREELVARAPEHKKISVSVDLPLSNESKRVLAFAAEEAERLEHRYIGPEHLLLGLLRETKSYAAQVLQKHGANLATMRSRIGEFPDTWQDYGAPKSGKDGRNEEPVRIHGAPFVPGYVKEAVTSCRRFLWQERAFVAPDIVVRRTDGAISFDKQLAEEASFRLVEGGWNEVACVICRWQLVEGDDPQRNTGYSNGRDWLCIECYERFLAT